MHKKKALVGAVAILGAIGSAQADEDYTYNLATIDARQMVKKDGIEAQRAKAAVTKATSVCKETPGKLLAGRAVKTSELLTDDGVFTRPVDLLEGAKAVFDGTKTKVDCTDFFANYAGIRKSTGFSHSEAIAALRTIAKAGMGLK